MTDEAPAADSTTIGEAVQERPQHQSVAENKVTQRSDRSGALGRVVEALLLVSESALNVDQLHRVLVIDDPLIDRAAVRDGLTALSERLRDSASELIEVSGGWRLQIRSEFNALIARLWQEKPPRLSRAMLETLALIVYRQPVTRGDIEQVRGVSVSSNIIRTLLERDWIRELGHKEVPGRPTLYGTTGHLLDDLGLKSLSQLPELPAVKDIAQLEAALQKLGISAEELSGAKPEAEPEADLAGSEARLGIDAAVEHGTSSANENPQRATAAPVGPKAVGELPPRDNRNQAEG